MAFITEEKEQVIIVSLNEKKFQFQIAEMQALIENLQAEVVLTVTMHRDSYNNATYLGKGKLEEVKELLAQFKIKTVVVNDNISPGQKRNIENNLNCKVLDRTEIILAIFVARATTKESKLQVELAQLQYLYPRLTRLWGHLSRQQGGIGMKGVGETQLEIDKRIVHKKISKLKQDLKKVVVSRDLQRKKRKKGIIPTVALVGYTNAGKSSMFNYFKGKEVFAKDQLFATLDTVVKKVELQKGVFYLADTVGFISNLPPFLVESFKSTLEEVVLADVLIHVVDGADRGIELRISSVEDILKELGLAEKPLIIAYNKADKLPKEAVLPKNGVVVSVLTGSNMDKLEERIFEVL